MVNNCIVCGEECKVIECFGSIENMGISFCDAHAEYCENCEKMICRVISR